MKHLPALSRLLKTILLFFVLSLQAQAATFTSISVISDSGFDGGSEETAVISAYKLWYQDSGVVSNPGYSKYKYCNGYVGAEYFAYFMGMFDKEHFFNYAVAGISTIEIPQVIDYMLQHKPTLDPTGLYIISVGTHDVFQSKISRTQSAENIKQALIRLHDNGARYFMVMNLPILSDLPNYRAATTAEREAGQIAYQAINTALVTKLNELSFKDSIVQFDTAQFFSYIPLNATSIGFTNITSGCLDKTNMTVCSNPDQYIYWDDVHLTEKTQSYLGYHMKVILDQANFQ